MDGVGVCQRRDMRTVTGVGNTQRVWLRSDSLPSPVVTWLSLLPTLITTVTDMTDHTLPRSLSDASQSGSYSIWFKKEGKSSK